MAQNVAKHVGHFWKNICHQELSKIAQIWSRWSQPMIQLTLKAGASKTNFFQVYILHPGVEL